MIVSRSCPTSQSPPLLAAVAGREASYPPQRRLSRRWPITSARVDPGGPVTIVRPLRCGGRFWPAPVEGPCGGTGRRARLKIEFRKECWFDSGQGHQSGCSSPFPSVRNRPHGARKPSKNRLFRIHRCSSPFVLIRSQPVNLLVFCVVSCWYRENKRSPRLSLFRTKELNRWPDAGTANCCQIAIGAELKARGYNRGSANSADARYD